MQRSSDMNRPGDLTPALGWRARVALVSVILAALLVTAVPVLAQDAASAPALILEKVEMVGATRTRPATLEQYFSLVPGQPIDQSSLTAAVADLRASGLFQSVSFYTRPGSQRGQVILVLEVKERGFDLRFGTGNTNLDGWYLVPVMVALDNQFGRGGRLDLQWRIGFRTSGALLSYARPRAGDGRDYWGTRLYALTTYLPYFYDGIEFRHEVKRAGIEGVYGRRYGERWIGEVGLNLQGVEAAAQSVAYSGSLDGQIEESDEVPYEQLPPEIQAGVGKSNRQIVHLDWQLDSRTQDQRAGTPVGGLWGRLKGSYIFQEGHSHGRLDGDIRVHGGVPGGVLAARLRASAVGEKAVFYDRLYLGGMYTVRGFPSNSLSAPGGDTWLWSGSLEYRSRILGEGDRSSLVGVFFADAGAAGRFDMDEIPGVSVGIGYGIRVRVPWIGWFGADVGFPLTRRPADYRFQATASIGWSF